MTMLKQILAQIWPEDWFISLDLKDAYIHIQIAPRHRHFLRFAFEGTAYQFTLMLFMLVLVLHTFVKCVDAALCLLRASGLFGGFDQRQQMRSVTSSGEFRSLH